MEKKKFVEKPLPPYVPFRTFLNVADGLRHAPPPKIDSSVTKSMGGALRYQLLATLRYLKLIDAGNTVLPTYKSLMLAEPDERKKILTGVLQKGYPFLFKPADQLFDLTTATYDMLIDKFRDEGVTGQTVARCATFFLQACSFAEVPVSEHLQEAKPHERVKGSRAPKSGAKRQKRKDGQPDTTNNDAVLKKFEVMQSIVTQMSEVRSLPPEEQDKWRKDLKEMFLVASGSPLELTPENREDEKS